MFGINESLSEIYLTMRLMYIFVTTYSLDDPAHDVQGMIGMEVLEKLAVDFDFLQLWRQ